jgi:hypothetical protein
LTYDDGLHQNYNVVFEEHPSVGSGVENVVVAVEDGDGELAAAQILLDVLRSASPRSQAGSWATVNV